MTDWLVRTAQNRLLGPLAEQDLKERILAGEFHLEDEVCSGDGYWIFLHERDEVMNRLGIEAPHHRILREDDTETGTQTLTDTTLPGRKKAGTTAERTVKGSVPLSKSAPAVEQQSPILALLLTLGGLGLVIFVVFTLRAVWLVSR